MEDLLDKDLRSVLGSRVRDFPKGKADTRKDQPLDACWERANSCGEQWITGGQTWEDKVKRVSPWACIGLGVCLICLVYVRCGWLDLKDAVPTMMASMAFTGWKLGRMW